MLDRDQIARETLAQLPPQRLERRIHALTEAHALFDTTQGRLTEADLRRVLELFNQDVSNGREVQGRFATGLVGRNANLLVGSLHHVNDLVPRLWTGDDAWLSENLVTIRRSGRLPGGGWLFLSMVLHARDPQRFLPRSSTMSRGLAVIEGAPVLAFRSGADYLEYCRRVHALLAAHEISPYGADVFLLNGFRAGQGSGIGDAQGDEGDTPAEGGSAPEGDIAPGGSADRTVAEVAAPAPAPRPPTPTTTPAAPPRAPEPGSVVVIASPPPAAPPPPSTTASSRAPSPPAPPKSDGPLSVGWLHLTDLHQGMGGARWLWPNVKSQLYLDLGRLHDACGPWDVVFFTGDLTQRGTAEEYDQLDRLLEHLWARLDQLGSRPQLVAVPGNHDLTRPRDPFDPVVVALRQWHEDRYLRDHILTGADNAYLARLRQAFAPYSAWAQRGRWCSAPRQEGIIPGDVGISLSLRGVDIGIVGLNSAFLQLTGGDYNERLDVDPRQLHEVCGHDAPEWLRRHHVNFLLTHHPASWLAPRARQEFYSEVDIPGRFAAHLCGHMHEGVSLSTAIGGAASRHMLQGSSLFGLEEYEARDGRRVQRVHGYSAGRLEIGGSPPRARVQVYPRRMIDNSLGRRIERDLNNYVLDDRGAFSFEVPVSRRVPA